jgi:hypothetical protein
MVYSVTIIYRFGERPCKYTSSPKAPRMNRGHIGIYAVPAAAITEVLLFIHLPTRFSKY